MGKIAFTALGGAREIGANSYLLNIGGVDLLIDCGMHPKNDGYGKLPRFDLLRRKPDALLVSHAHIDHCGAVPWLLRDYPETPVYATKPTLSIMNRMLHNSVSVMTILGKEKGIPEYPLYHHSHVESAMHHAVGFDFERTFAPIAGTDAEVSFHHGGHVLGAASILIRTPGHTVLYTGDVLMRDQELLGACVPPDPTLQVDTLIIESTRGAADDAALPTYEAEMRRFADAIAKVLEAGGVVLVPTFALGRMQEMLNTLYRLQEEGRLPQVPVYASGLGRAVYETYIKYEHLLRPEANLVPLVEFEKIGDMWNREERRALLSEPAIVVATSGMMVENTPSALLAMEMARETRHGIFFVGYLDQDTLGYQVLNAQPGDKLVFMRDSDPVPLKLTNIQRFHFSGHASRDDLQGIIERTKPRDVIFVHGDEDAIDWMAANCDGSANKHAPAVGETLTLGG